MKILWVKTDFLHPTTKGGHIRTLETLRRLRARHEIHYVAFDGGADNGEGVRRSAEYCHRAYPVAHRPPDKRSPAFLPQLAAGLVSPMPVAVSRWRSRAMRDRIDGLLRDQRFDAVVCDFLAPAPNISALDRCILFQHNVETSIWRRQAGSAAPPKSWYFAMQARKMFEYERRVCRSVRHVIAVSPVDAEAMRRLFAVADVSDVPTGVDLDYFSPEFPAEPGPKLVFVGSMDWLPNIDGMEYFAAEIFPRVLERCPGCSLDIVGREPPAAIRKLAGAEQRIRVTGTVPDIRPYLWNAAVSVVPLRIGGGTRLKIYESMAARVPVVSTSIGAEGLLIHPPVDIRIADRPEAFAAECAALLASRDERARQAAAAWDLVSANFSWERVAERFESILERHALQAG